MAALAKKPMWKLDDEDILEKVMKDFEAANQFREPYETEWREAIEEYYMIKKSNLVEQAKRHGRSYMLLPRAYEEVQTKLARLVATTFAGQRYVEAEPLRVDLAMAAIRTSRLINWQMRQVDFEERATTWIHQAIVFGTSPAFVGHDDEVIEMEDRISPEEYVRIFGRLRPEDEKLLRQAINAAHAASIPPLPPLSDEDPLPPLETISHITEQFRFKAIVPKTVYSGPTFEPLDLLDTWFDPWTRSYRLDGCRFVIRRFYATAEELEEENEERESAGLQPQYINLKELKKRDKDGNRRTESGQAKRLQTLGMAVSDLPDKSHECLEFWYSDGSVLTIADRDLVIRKEASPFRDGRLPIVLIVHDPQDFSVYGRGLIRWIKDLLAGQRRRWNDRFDIVNLMMMPPIFARSDTVDPFEFRTNFRPGGLIEVELMPQEPLQNAMFLQNFPPTMAELGYQEHQLFEVSISKTTGMTPGLKGERPAPRTPYSLEATLLQEANLRLQLNLRVVGYGIAKVAELFHYRNWIFMPPETAVKYLGEDGQEYWDQIHREDILYPMRFRMVSSSMEPLANKQVQAQNLVQVVSALPNFLQMWDMMEARGIDPAAMLEELFAKFDFKPGRQVLRRQGPVDTFARLIQNPQVLQFLLTPEGQQLLMQVLQVMAQQQGQAQQAPQQPAPEQVPQAAAAAPPPAGQIPVPQPQTPEEMVFENEQIEVAERENDRMMQGLTVDVSPDDHHIVHIEVHGVALQIAEEQAQDPNIANDPVAMQRVAAMIQVLQDHIAEHRAMAEQAAQGQGAMIQ